MPEPKILSVVVDKQSCLSSGRCVEAAASAFRFDDDLLGEATAGAFRLPSERLAEIARSCPGLAIAIVREGDGPE